MNKVFTEFDYLVKFSLVVDCVGFSVTVPRELASVPLWDKSLQSRVVVVFSFIDHITNGGRKAFTLYSV